ncbi:MAG: amidohydrolase family protein [Pseudomonadota bacterium]
MVVNRTILASALFFLSGAASAVSLIQAGALLDRPGQAARGASTIVVDGGKVSAVLDGFVGTDKYPGATVVDLRQKFVLPGLIDSHVHLTTDRAGVDVVAAAMSSNPADWAYEASMNANKTLQAGFTTVRNLGDGDQGVTLALRDAVAKGWVQGPRILDAGNSISATAGHMDERNGLADWARVHANENNLCNSLESCRRAVRLQVGRGVDVIKIATTGGVNSRIGVGLGKQLFDDEVKSLVDTAHMYGKKVAVHAHGNDGVDAALLAGADSIEHGTMMDENTVKLFLKSKAYYVPTLSTVLGYRERLAKNPNAYTPEVLAKIQWRLGVTGKSLKLAHARGVRIAFGTDAGVSKHGDNAKEFPMMVEFGMSPAEAIKAATVNAADLLGISAIAGSIEAGKSADIIAVASSPLQDINQLGSVQFVMAQGKIVKR